MKAFVFVLACLSLIKATAASPDAPRLTSKARSLQPGELVVLTIATSADVEAVTVRAFDHDSPAYKVDAHTWQALVGIDLDVRSGTYPVSVKARARGGMRSTTEQLRVHPKQFATRRLRVDEGFVNPPPELRDRIERESLELAQIWKRSASERLWTGRFARPVPGAATSRFGTRSIFNGELRNPHGGADFLSPAGTPVESPNAGTVVLARDLYFSGNTVVIDHGLGLFSMLAHLSAIEVREGDALQTGRVVGRVGATGRVTGPHLHWAVRAGGARVDPLSVLALLGREAPVSRRSHGPRLN